jgi:Ca2+-binding EF-hand superfamily protein
LPPRKNCRFDAKKQKSQAFFGEKPTGLNKALPRLTQTVANFERFGPKNCSMGRTRHREPRFQCIYQEEIMVSSVNSSSTSYISQLFAKLDTKSQGYIEKSDLASAFSQIGSSSSDSSSVDDVFAALDSNSDGKVTESEFSTTLSKLQEELDSQFNSMRMDGYGGAQGSGGMSGMPPPPPENDSGFTKDELTSQLDEIGSTDSTRSSFISNIVNNFEAADTDGDGKVTFAEAQAYSNDSSSSSTSSSATSSTASTSTSTTSSSDDAQLLKKIMQLMHAYGDASQSQQNSALSGLLSISA